jgi:hypothetical protein
MMVCSFALLCDLVHMSYLTLLQLVADEEEEDDDDAGAEIELGDEDS